jgi:small subunit ribosomal protein S16
MVKIRLKRAGTKNTPAYRIVVADSRSPRDGRFIEEIGSYTPLQKGVDYHLKLERAEYWLGKGAQPTETVASFIREARKLKDVPATAAVAVN